MVAMAKSAVLLLAHGTPEALDEIPDYLLKVTGGRPLPESVVAEIRHRYSLIGKSPLTEITLAQARALQQQLGVPVFVGMRNWHPYIADTMRQMREQGVTRLAVLCLAPQNSRTSVGLYRRAVFAEAAPDMQIDFIDEWAGHPLLIAAFAGKLRDRWTSHANQNTRASVLFTAHSVPCRTMWSKSAIPLGADVKPNAVEATEQTPDSYAQQAKRTAELVAQALASEGMGDRDWFFAFQSQGASGGPWIGPTVEATLQALAEEGRKSVILQPVGFLCDHVEILYDIDIAFQETAKTLGIQLERTESLNCSPVLIAALADLAEKSLQWLGA